MRDEKISFDFKVKNHNVFYPAHKEVLVRNIYFSHILARNKESKIIDAGDIVSNIMLEKFINYLYNGCIVIDEDSVVEVALTANYFSDIPLLIHCSTYIKKYLHLFDKSDLISFSVQIGDLSLKNIVESFINKDFDMLFRCKDFHISLESLIDLLSCSDLNVNNEEVILNFVISWYKFNTESSNLVPESSLRNLLEIIRYSLIMPDSLKISIKDLPESMRISFLNLYLQAILKPTNKQILRNYKENLQEIPNKAKDMLLSSISPETLQYYRRSTKNDKLLYVICLKNFFDIHSWRPNVD